MDLFPVSLLHMLETRPTSIRSNVCDKAGGELAGLRFWQYGGRDMHLPAP
jgi:hypothetical protein